MGLLCFCSNNDLLGTVTLAYEGTDFPRNVEQHAIVLPKRSANGKEMKGSLACQIKAPAASLSGALLPRQQLRCCHAVASPGGAHFPGSCRAWVAWAFATGPRRANLPGGCYSQVP
jgi:hypothetical protein